MPGGRPPSDPKERFLAKIVRGGNGCEEFDSNIQRDGYARFHFRGRPWQAHRVAYTLFVAEIPEGKCLLHSCDNRRCVNVAHLSIGTTADNISDMDAKKRRGTKSKTTEAHAKVILRLLGLGISQQKIAEAFGIHQTSISRIKLGKTKLFQKE